MSQPQPDQDRPAAQPSPTDQPTRIEQQPGSVPVTAGADDRDEADERATDQLPPRWSGSAAVPPPPPKKRRWLETRIEPAPAPEPPPSATPRRDPTLEFPTAERESLESSVPVDPWAGADADPWGVPGPVPVGPEPHPPGAVSPPIQPGPPALPGPPAPAGPQIQPGPPVRKPGRPGKRGRSAPPPPYGPQAPPPGWRAPAGYVPVAVRRRRRWPWFLLASFLCCCGIPGYYLQPMWSQYPANVNLPAEVADLRRSNDPASTRTADRLKASVRTEHLLAEETFAAVYTDPAGKQVVIFGSTGFRFSPDSDINEEMTRLADKYRLTGVRSIETRTRGAHQQCGVGRADGADVVVCTWADHGSLATALFTRLSVQDSSDLFSQLRNSIITRG